MASTTGLAGWQGERIGKLIAIACHHPTKAAHKTAPEVFAAAATGTETVLIEPGQLGDFLVTHAGAILVCYDVAHLHSCMLEVLRHAGHLAGQDALWRFASESRLDDVILLEQRVRAIEETSFPLRKTLCDLARKYLQAPGTINCDGNFAPDVVAAAETILALYDRFLPIAAKMPWYEELNNGPLGVGVEVQAAIAMEQAKQHGLRMNALVADRLFERIEDLARRATGVLRLDQEAAACFHWEGDEIITRRGKLKIRDSRLRSWLERRLGRLPDASGLAWFRPLGSDGRISIVPDHWHYWLGSDPLVCSWVDLAKAVNTRYWLQEASPHLRVQSEYGIIPHIAYARNDVEFAHRNAHGLFRPADSHRFIVVSFPDLELRAWARFQLPQFAGKPFPIRDCLLAGQDVYRATASELSTTFGGGKHDRIIANDQIAAGLANLTEGDWEVVARTLLTAMPRMLSPAHIRELLKRDLPLRSFGQSAVQRLYDLIADDLHPQLGLFVRPLQLDVLMGQLQADPKALANLLPGGILASDDLYRYLVNVVTGHHDDRRIYERLLGTVFDPQHRRALAAMTPEVLLQLLSATFRITFSGRVGQAALGHQGGALLYLDLADEVRKAVAYHLVHNGHRLVAITADDIVVEVVETRASSTLESIHTLAQDTAKHQRLLDSLGMHFATCQSAPEW